MKRNTLILKCFLPLACANLDGSQKEGGNFLILLQKKGGSLRKGGRFKPWRNYGKSYINDYQFPTAWT